MTEETTQPITVSEMLRTTTGNTSNLMLRIADHIDQLEAELISCQARIAELEAKSAGN
jgi:hypothetical protein